MTENGQIELSVVMPCLNEADTLEVCIKKAQKVFQDMSLQAEVVVADNGSTDGSLAIAERTGARVIHVKEKGYGNALMGGIEAARGKYVIMGDADDSYNFLEIPKFVTKLREGFDLVQGCRLPTGGGTVMKAAMPFLHRWLGNPMFSFLVRLFFNAPIHDVYCGLRGFTKKLYSRLNMSCTGMEFATEMIIKSSLFSEKIAEVPITLHPDGRKSHPPHLKTFRDGWGTLRFFFLYSPKWLYLVPGIFFILIGLVGYGLILPGHPFLGPHSLLMANLSIIIGYQSLLFAVLAKTYAIGQGLIPFDNRIRLFYDIVTLERALMLSCIFFVTGICLILVPTQTWIAAELGKLDYPVTMRWVIPGTLFIAIGFQSIFASLFGSILGIGNNRGSL